MQIQLENADSHSIKAYSDTEIQINTQIYHENIIVSQQAIISGWKIDSLDDLDEKTIEPLLELKPEIILIGHRSQSFAPGMISAALAEKRIGIECMSIGAACRSFNILLGEQRRVVLGIIFSLAKNR